MANFYISKTGSNTAPYDTRAKGASAWSNLFNYLRSTYGAVISLNTSKIIIDSGVYNENIQLAGGASLTVLSIEAYDIANRPQFNGFSSYQPFGLIYSQRVKYIKFPQGVASDSTQNFEGCDIAQVLENGNGAADVNISNCKVFCKYAANEPPNRPKIVNCTFVVNASPVIDLHGIAAGYKIENNIIQYTGGVGGIGINLTGAGVGTVDYNDLYNCQATNTSGATVTNLGSNGKQVNPLFTNAGAGDYSLQAGSPVLASGVSGAVDSDVPMIDYQPILRPSTPSMGAFDRVLVVVPPVLNSAVRTDGQVQIDWSAVTGATGYRLYYEEGASIDEGATTVDISGVSAMLTLPRHRYTFGVTALDGATETAMSSTITVEPYPSSEYIGTFEAQAKDLLIQQYRTTESVPKLLVPFASGLQELENTFDKIMTLRSLADATGAQLDAWGVVIDYPRQGDYSDDDYRRLLRAKVVVNHSSGQPDALINAIVLMLRYVTVDYAESTPARINLTLNTSLVIDQRMLLLIRKLKAGGVGMSITIAPDTGFPFVTTAEGSGTSYFPTGRGLSSVAKPTGGQLAAITV